MKGVNAALVSLSAIELIRDGLFKPNNRFVRFSISKSLPSQALDGLGIIGQRLNRGAELSGRLLFLMNLSIQPDDLFSHALILADERQIPDRQGQQAGDK